MLKLERAPRREGNIHVIVREKERLITKPLALAFLTALGIHLSLMLLFHVDLFKIEFGLSVFPPVQVETHLSLKESTIADARQVFQTIRGLPPLPSSAPKPFARPSFVVERPSQSGKAMGHNIKTFYQVEKEVYEPQFDPAIRNSIPPLKMIVSGSLAEYPLISNNLHNRKPPLQKVKMRLIYLVRADPKSGKIFWVEPKETTPYPAVNKFSESLLKEMHFDFKTQQTPISGEIEFHYRQDHEGP